MPKANSKQDINIKDPKLRCKDFDNDCYAVAKNNECLKCWLYAPEQGLCPFLVENKNE